MLYKETIPVHLGHNFLRPAFPRTPGSHKTLASSDADPGISQHWYSRREASLVILVTRTVKHLLRSEFFSFELGVATPASAAAHPTALRLAMPPGLVEQFPIL